MRRKALLSFLLSAAMILGPASTAFAAGQIPSDEVTVSAEASALESQDEFETEQAGQDYSQDDSNIISGLESAEAQKTSEEGEAGTETGSEEVGIVEEEIDGDSNATATEDSEDENKTDSAEEEEEKPETLVGAEGERVSVGENVTAGFDSETGTVTFYSQGGTLSKEWASVLGIDISTIRVITISDDSDVMYLPADSSRLFGGAYEPLEPELGLCNLHSLNLSKVITTNVTDMSYLFSGCSSLQTLDLSGFDTSNVTDMSYLFSGCSSLQTLDVSGFDTSNVTDMSYLFSGCSSIQTLDVSGFDTSKVTSMRLMFEECRSLQTLNVSGFNTSNVTDISGMFFNCNSILELDVSNFDTSNVNMIHFLFYGCNSIRRLDLSSFDISKADGAWTLLNDIGKLLVILTPVNLQVDSVDLPGLFVDVYGTEYYRLPTGLSESIRLTKKGVDIPVDLEILSLSDDYYGKNGTQASFHIDAQGSGTVSYQWQYKLANSNEWRTPSQASAMTADYTFKLKPSYDNMQVRCIVSDKYGFEVISETRNVNVFALTSQPADAVVTAGQTVNFDVDAIGQDLTYQWYYKRPNASWRKVTVKGYNTSSLPITGGEKNNGTSYRCVVTDSAGHSITSSSAVLTVVTTLQIIDLSDDVYGKGGTEATFHIDAVGQGNLTYQWQYKLAGESKWRTPAQASAKTTDYVFKLRTSYDNIEVRCIVKDAAGNTCTSDIRKANVFAITKQPDHVFAVLGENVTFAVKGIGQNLTYQWYSRALEGSWIKVAEAGNNTSSLTITAQVRNNGYQYRCYVYDGLGNRIKSQAAMLIERNEEYED